MDIDGIIAEAAGLVAERYVFPEVGVELRRLLEANAAAGRYAGAADPPALAALVTADLRSVNGDLHLRLKYHEEEIPDLPAEEVVVAMIAEQAARTMGGIAAIERLPGNVARLDLNPLLFPPSMAAEAVSGAMHVVAPADALVLDLRRTVGGDPSMVAFLCSYLFDEPTHLIDIYQREGDRTVQSWTLPHVPGARFGGTKPVYVLTSRATFSGGEELAFDLQQHRRATVVGERTGGGAHPRTGHRLHPHLELTLPTGRALHPTTGANWEGTGVLPDVETPAERALEVVLSRVS